MDSLTQIILGAATGELVEGQKLGNKAMLWGAIGGTIPDLDVFLNFFYNPIESALLHRGFSHSLIFALIFSPIFAWILNKLYKKKYTYTLWLKLFFISIVTHPILDMFTNYGTQFLWPLQNRISFNSVFVIDPLYTLPFLFCCIVVLFKKKESISRRRWNNFGLLYSTSYLFLLLIIKIFVYQDTKTYFKNENISQQNIMITPMPLTGFYWLVESQTKDSVFVTYKSIFHDFDSHEMQKFSKNNQNLNSIPNNVNSDIQKLKFFSNGFFTSEYNNDTILFYDLRFGTSQQLTNGKRNNPILGYGMVIEDGNVQNIFRVGTKDLIKDINFGAYLNKVF